MTLWLLSPEASRCHEKAISSAFMQDNSTTPRIHFEWGRSGGVVQNSRLGRWNDVEQTRDSSAMTVAHNHATKAPRNVGVDLHILVKIRSYNGRQFPKHHRPHQQREW